MSDLFSQMVETVVAKETDAAERVAAAVGAPLNGSETKQLERYF